MKRRLAPIFLGIFLIAPSGFARGPGRSIEVRLTSPKLVEVEPGRIVTGSYLILNGIAHEEEFHQYLKLPKGWRPIFPYDYPIRLAAGEKKVQLVTFAVPRNFPAGRYEVIYSLTGTKDPSLRADDTFSVMVLPIVKLDALVDRKPQVVMAGDEYDVRLRLVNKGNCATAVKLNVRGNPEFPFRVEPVETTLAAGESNVANISVTTDPKLRRETNHLLIIRAEAKDKNGNIVSAQQTVSVRVLPRLATVVDQRQRIPTRMRFIALGNNDNNGFQVEYSGSGNLDETGRRNLAFLFRGPDVQDRSIYGTHDVLRLNYSDQLLDLKFGDRVYVLSPLTERLNYGRGVEAGLHPKNSKVAAFYLETRWEEPQEKEAGAYIYHVFRNLLTIKGNYLNKRRDRHPPDAGYEANLYTLQANLKLGKTNNLGAEFGYSFSDKNSRVRDLAHRIFLDGRLSPRLWYTFENIYSGPKFFGYYNDAVYSSGSIAFPIYHKLLGNVSYHIFENNLDLDPSKPIAIRERSIRGILSYRFPAGTNVSLDFENRRRKDKIAPIDFDFDQSIWRFGLGQTYRKLGFQTYSELATFKNRLLETRTKLLDSYSIYAYFWPSPRQTYALFTKYGYNSYTGEPKRANSVGITSSLRVNRLLNMNLAYNKNNFSSDKSLQQDVLISSVDFTLPNRHLLSLKVRWLNFNNGRKDEYSFYMAYTIPFKMPALRKKSFGVLRGRIYDGDRVGTPPLSNVILSVDNLSTVTNKDGEFVFPQLKPGRYSLWIDQKSIGLRNIPTKSLPIPVEIKGGETTVQDIGVSSSCNISGKVVVCEYTARDKLIDHPGNSSERLFLSGGLTARSRFGDDDLVETSGLSHILVEITNGEDVLRQFTDKKGRFSFSGIRPGNWRLRVYNNNLPPYHYLEKEILQVRLTKGAEEEITIRVLPRVRSIKMLEGKEIR